MAKVKMWTCPDCGAEGFANPQAMGAHRRNHCPGPEDLRVKPPPAVAAVPNAPTAAVAVLRWEDPPPKAGRKPISDRYTAALDALRAHPKRWAVLSEHPGATTATTYATKLRHHTKHVEFVTRRTASGSTLYGRYVGS